VSERPDTAGVTQKARAELTAKDTPNGTVADYVKSVLEHETDLAVQFAGEHDKLMVLAKDRDEWKERCKGALDYDDTLKWRSRISRLPSPKPRRSSNAHLFLLSCFWHPDSWHHHTRLSARKMLNLVLFLFRSM
jgi:hypothetical protein